ncbi:class I SAM-dependent methyltransferase [Actinomadura madurae]|uniref:class I SAM-dependent methyltransferase n=1 Tax=Actinomadura madurae TaxID=1993 RepID=UPI0020276783|nr:methyltransferase domain-containing protein [Actinomadura madurae]MCP9955190.1 methyltransferase domain-containing protein [Actinomadura madurae]MCP9971924.1 methyltransferase domain-containing protein [Actinomadura madurae]MCP9984427.1 methyltransferase domain-containing protein [Actinomadura madurae]MCQ0004020.1 methyltransferase domain-containing protein [Actinomadura madurae]URN00666.1 methyltransferase domain-containing protein [Actinomadura madurae]
MEPRPWTSGKATRSPFVLPSGLRGHLAGRVMFRMNRQDEVAALLDVRPGEDVLEVGYGPGALTRRLARTATGRVCGVDPSPQMRRMALKHAPRADLRLGTAADTGFGDAEFDCVVSVNNVGIWPCLEAGLDELRRVTRPGGRVVIAEHGGKGSSRLARRLALPDDQLDRVERELRRRFAIVTRRDLSDLTTFTACRT